MTREDVTREQARTAAGRNGLAIPSAGAPAEARGRSAEARGRRAEARGRSPEARGRRADVLLGCCGGSAATGPAPPTPWRRGDERSFERWLGHFTERLDPFMAWLGLLFALLVLLPLLVRLGPVGSRTVQTAGSVIWGVFAADFAAKLWLAPHRLRFLRRHWLSVLMLVVPTLRVLRLGALVRLGRAFPAARVVSSSYRVAGTARRLLRSRVGYLGAISSLSILVIAELGYLADHPRTFRTFGDALLWALSVVIGGQGDPVPATRAGRLVMAAGFLAGAVFIASLAGTVGAFFLENRRERAAREEARPDPPTGA